MVAIGRFGRSYRSTGAAKASTIRRALIVVLAAGPPAVACSAAVAEPTDRSIILSREGFTLRWHLQAGINVVVEENLFWNFAQTVAPAAGFDSDPHWLEVYAKPGIGFEQALGDATTLYGKLSAVASYTGGIDAYDTGNTGRITLEEGYIGLRHAPAAPGFGFDLSVGPRELKLGTGMLIANGGTSGFERGALKLGPRKAWEMAAIGRLTHAGLTATGFYIDPNELTSSDGENRLAGADLRYDPAGGGYAGLTYLQVLNSESPYVRAAPGGLGPPTILPGAREGTSAVNLYARTAPFEGVLENWFFAGDVAHQWNDDVDLRAWAGRVQAGYTFAALPWSPSLVYSYQTFSGDDPGTARLERFDPLYYEGSPSAWATGSKSSMVFINSNVQAHGLALRLQPSPRDTLTFRYAHIRANELRSPIQFGQATRVDTTGGAANVVSGVTDAHLSDDFFLEYSRILNPNTYLTAGVSVGVPGAGIRNVAGGRADVWSGGFVNLVVNF